MAEGGRHGNLVKAKTLHEYRNQAWKCVRPLPLRRRSRWRRESSSTVSPRERTSSIQVERLGWLPPSLAGLRLGPYELHEPIGHGGMAEVYRATRADDQYRREVAVKLVKPGLRLEQVDRRFRVERQILAQLEHPNIVPVHEVGRDVELLGLSPERPDSRHAFRMLCRHNRWVQEFGKVKDPDEISRREKVWRDFVRRVEGFTGRPCGALSAEEFRRALDLGLRIEPFALK